MNDSAVNDNARGAITIQERARQLGTKYAVIFDLDSTLVDVEASFDAVVTALVKRHSGHDLPAVELRELRAEGGFNDDWLAAHELIRRHGGEIPLKVLIAEAMELYLEIALEKEFLMVEEAFFIALKTRHPTFIVTGRSRPEYDPIWASRLDNHFVQIYCLGDVPGLRGKPAPDYLSHLISEHDLVAGVYVGNAVDDMWAARDAGLDRIGVSSTQSREALIEAGAQLVVESPLQVLEVFGLG